VARRLAFGALLVLGALGALVVLGGPGGGVVPTLRPDLDAETLLALGPQQPFAKPDPTGTSGAGGCSVVHHAGGVRVGSGTQAPCAHLYRTGVPAFENTIGIAQDAAVFFLGVKEDAAGNPHSQILRSTDAGRSWQNVSPLIAGQDAHGTTEDPYLYVDPRTSRVFDDDLVPPCHMVSFTDDGGSTWSPVALTGPGFVGEGAQVMRAVVTSSSSLVVVGNQGPQGDHDGAVWTSDDGEKWAWAWDLSAVRSALDGAADQSMRAVVVYRRHGISLLAFGVTRQGDSEDAQVWTATDPSS